jgi:hypothetical protein
LSCFTKSSVLSLVSILSLSPEILSSTCSYLLEWPSTVFFVRLKGLFVSRICLITFSGVFHIFVQLLFHILCCLLYFIYLFFFLVSCFTLVFIDILSEFM